MIKWKFWRFEIEIFFIYVDFECWDKIKLDKTRASYNSNRALTLTLPFMFI